jgi:23S rRNA (cytosine1962-C5)-methyltransferase
MVIVTLKAKRDRPTRMGHPWIFSGAIASVDGEPAVGEPVIVQSASGDVLGVGAWSPESQIRIRMWRFGDAKPVDEAFFQEKIAAALAVRAEMAERFSTNALRIVNAEADGLPGITVDRYGDVLSGQFATAGAEWAKPMVVRALMALTGAKSFYERSDVDGRTREGLPQVTGLLAGEAFPDRVIIHEGDVQFGVDIRAGHKTGYYLDQRESRRIVASYAKGRDVLNTFSYTGGFGVAAQKAGAKSVTHVDISAPALAQARANTTLNGFTEDSATFIQGNVFQELRAFRDRGRSFGLVVLDPPKFAETRAQTMKALRGYKDVNLLGIKLVERGGYLATFSCSGAITPELFRTVVAEAARDAGRTVRIVQELRQAPDHVESLAFPEGLYLKGLLCYVE